MVGFSERGTVGMVCRILDRKSCTHVWDMLREVLDTGSVGSERRSLLTLENTIANQNPKKFSGREFLVSRTPPQLGQGKTYKKSKTNRVFDGVGIDENRELTKCGR